MLFTLVDARLKHLTADNMKLLKGKIIWNSADAPFTMPLDLYCVTHVHGKMILEVTLNFEEAQNKSVRLEAGSESTSDFHRFSFEFALGQFVASHLLQCF